MPQNIAWFNQVDREDIMLVGGNAASLGEMTKAGLPIPNGFVITSHAYHEFIHGLNIDIKIKHLINTINFNDPHSLKQVSEIIKREILEGELSSELYLSIYNSYKKLGQNSPVAIRSSFTTNSLSKSLFIQHEKTFLNVRGETNIIINIKKSWASLFDEEAILFRHENKLEHGNLGISVVVQKMIEADASGVIDTIDLKTENKEKIIIKAIYGIGELLTENKIHPDYYVVSKTNDLIFFKEIQPQNKMLKKTNDGERLTSVSLLSRKKQKISDDQILELADLARKIEKHYFFPQEIEWAIEKGKIYFLSSKQIYANTDLKSVKKNTDIKLTQEKICTATKVYINLSEPGLALKAADKDSDGVGLLRAEFMMAEIGIHPKKMLKDGKGKQYISELADGLEKICTAFFPRPVIYRASDFKTNEYRSLEGGRDFEPVEANPLIGYRGSYRYVHDPEVFKLELEAIKYIRNKKMLKNLWLMLPYVRTPKELGEVKKIITKSGLVRSDTFKLWMMVEIPSNVILLDKFIEIGIDGVSIGTNDLTMLILGTDRDNSEVIQEFDENNEAVLWAIEKTIATAHKHGITSSICGLAASYPSVLSTAIRSGITSVSVAPYLVEPTKRIVSELEEKILSEKKNN